MLARPPNDTHRRRGVWLAVLLLGAPTACSSDSPAASPDAGVADTAPPEDAPSDGATEDASPDGRGGAGGTVRGGSGGTNRGGSGGSGGSSGAGPDAAPDGEGPAAQPPANDGCAEPQVIPMGAARVDVAATTRGARHDLDLACAPGGADVVFSFTLTERELVYADTFGAAFDTILAFTDACAGGDGGVPGGAEPSCADDACGTKQSQVVAVLPPGKHYLVLSGGAAATGDVTIHFEHAPVGSGLVAPLGVGAAVTSGTTSGDGRLALCEAGGPENSYWWTACQGFAGGPFTASTCSNTMYDSMLALQIPRTPAPTVCNDDACMLQAAITTSLPPGAGLHVLTVDGFTPRHKGAYSLSTTRP